MAPPWLKPPTTTRLGSMPSSLTCASTMLSMYLAAARMCDRSSTRLPMLKSLMSYHAGSRCLVTVTSSSGDHGKIHLMPGRAYRLLGSFASHVSFSGEPPRPCKNMTTPSTSPSVGLISIGGARAGKCDDPPIPAAAEVPVPKRSGRCRAASHAVTAASRSAATSHLTLSVIAAGEIAPSRDTPRAPREPGRGGASRVPRNAARWLRASSVGRCVNSVRPVIRLSTDRFVKTFVQEAKVANSSHGVGSSIHRNPSTRDYVFRASLSMSLRYATPLPPFGRPPFAVTWARCNPRRSAFPRTDTCP